MKIYIHLINAAEYAAGEEPSLAAFMGNLDCIEGWHCFTEVDVDLPPRSDLVEKAEAQINEIERKTREEFENKMTAINDQRAKLLAIGHEVSQ